MKELAALQPIPERAIDQWLADYRVALVGRDASTIDAYLRVIRLGRCATSRGRCRVARPVPAHRTRESVGPASWTGGDDCALGTLFEVGGGTSGRD